MLNTNQVKPFITDLEKIAHPSGAVLHAIKASSSGIGSKISQKNKGAACMPEPGVSTKAEQGGLGAGSLARPACA